MGTHASASPTDTSRSAAGLSGSRLAPPGRLSGLELGALLAVLIVCRLLQAQSIPIYDDAFISFRYARNLASGLGLVYNPGAPWEPVLGTTSPGYTVLLAGLRALGFDLPAASRAFNLACDIASAVLLVQLLGRRPAVATVALLVFASMPEIARISGGGMEPPLLVAMALGATWLAERGRLVSAGTVAALACTVRPEAVLLVGALALFHARGARSALRLLAPSLVTGTAVGVALWWFYGHPIPQSVRAKAGRHGLRPHAWRVNEVLEQAFASSAAMVACMPLAAAGFWIVFRRRIPLRAFALFALLVPAAYLGAGIKTWGWYYYATLVAWAAALGLAVDALMERVARRQPGLAFDLARPHAPLVLGALAVLAVAVYTWSQPDEVTPGVYESMARWAREARIAERRATIAASDIGAIGYYSDGQILDTEGLVWPEAKEHRTPCAVIRSEEPDYAMFVAQRWRLGTFMSDPVSVKYEPVARFTTTPNLDVLPDMAVLQPGWRQDYVLFERRGPREDRGEGSGH
jgi:arabinofuranosyltransferase